MFNIVVSPFAFLYGYVKTAYDDVTHHSDF
jgi:hypothetical protein